MDTRYFVIIIFLILSILQGCDRQIEQTVVVRANLESASLNSLWLVETDDCGSAPIRADWYRDGLWIFRASSTRGGVGVVTQELALCINDGHSSNTRVWHSIHGGGAPLIVLSCVLDEKNPCRMYEDGYTKGVWSEDGQ